MNGKEQLQEKQPQEVITVAFVVCLLSEVLIYCLARPAVERIGIRWAEFLAYAVIPLLLTFVVLYRSNWHRDFAGVRRTTSMLLISGFILSAVLIVIAFSVFLLLFGFNAVSGGFHP